MLAALLLFGQSFPIPPARSEMITPNRIDQLMWDAKAKPYVQGGNPRNVGGAFVFDGAGDGNRQVDPQIAVGGGYVVNCTNNGMLVYDKQGNWKGGVHNKAFGQGIDPKLLFDPINKVYVFDIWPYWLKEQGKPVNLCVSATSNPLKGWNIYPVKIPDGVDGGGIGQSRKWVGYSFPGGKQNTIILRLADMKAGKPTTAYHFDGSLGQPVHNQDATDDLYFFKLSDHDMTITRVTEGKDGVPVVAGETKVPHGFEHVGHPPASPMKNTDKRTASGDRNPKGIVLQSGCLWFSHTVNIDGRAAVQWHQVKLDGTVVQSGVISSPTQSYIETTLGVNQRGDVLVGFQETSSGMFISARCAFRRASDPPGTLRPMMRLAEGFGPTEGGAWGDYSCTTMDGDNRSDLWTVQSNATEQGHGACVIARAAPK